MVTVEDNGMGFNQHEVDDKKHSGLEIIKSRVNYLHGTIAIDSRQKVGTTVVMEFLIEV
jgi:two-component system, NarL family, sensor kinase